MRADRGGLPPLPPTHLPGSSPFERVFKSQRAGLPAVFTRQFLSPGPVHLTGTMARVWHLPLLHPLFWLIGNIGLLVPKSGEDIPTTLEIIPHTMPDDRIEQVWNRTLHFEGPVRFNSCVVFNPKLNRVVEKVGPGKALSMIWDIHFEKPDRMAWRSVGWQILGLPLPAVLARWLFGDVFFSQMVEKNDRDRIHIAMQIRHPLIGLFFEYRGTFEVLAMEAA